MIDLLEGFSKKERRVIFSTRILLLTGTVFLMLFNREALNYDLKLLLASRNINMHVTSYDPIIDYLLGHEPEGTSIATAEPGNIGFKLGPRYKLIDELGLVTPGVAENIIKGNLDFPFTMFSPQYVIVSWGGKYSPHERSWFSDFYEFVGEFSHPYWELNLQRGAYLYKRKS